MNNVSRSSSPVPMDTTVSLPEDDPCSICMESFNGREVKPTVVRTRCGHPFDLNCISRWFAVGKRSCALCRGEALPLVREDGAHIDESSPYCEALPLQACRSGDAGTLRKLLSDDPSIGQQVFRSAVSGRDIDLFYMAVETGHNECLQALIDAGADLNAARTTVAAPMFITAIPRAYKP